MHRRLSLTISRGFYRALPPVHLCEKAKHTDLFCHCLGEVDAATKFVSESRDA